MLRVLRQLTAEENRQVAVHCGARPGATPEEIIRALSRVCGALTWGIFPAATDDLLLDHAGRRLGMPPVIGGGSRVLAARERAIFACYLRQAWTSAPPDRRREVLCQAVTRWDNPTLPPPVSPLDEWEDNTLDAALEALLHHSTGCRA